jgi:hypothetical protein
MKHRIISIWIVSLICAPVLHAQFRLEDGPEERARVRLRAVRLRIVPTTEAGPGECLQLGLDDLKVSVRGEPVPRERLLELERRREPTLHALLIDTSGSMNDRLELARHAAVEYVNWLRPEYEKALLATLDDSVILLEGATRDKATLLAAVDRIRAGETTSMIDGLYYVIRELDAHRERPVILLVTDGFDTGSIHERAEVNDLAERRPDLTVFTIGVKLPPLQSGAPPGYLSTRRFLQRLARRTNGEFFDDPTGARLKRVFDRVRELLENEATLTFLDPDPQAEEGRVKVGSANPLCRAKAFRSPKEKEPAPRKRPIPPPYADPPQSIALQPAHAYGRYYSLRGRGGMDPDCQGEGIPDPPWFLRVDESRITGCNLDVTMDPGILYNWDSPLRIKPNDFIRQKTRPFEIPLPPLKELPNRPVQLLDGLADFALSVADFPIEIDGRQVPASKHARPFHDYPSLANGNTFLEARHLLARSKFVRPDYRDWVRSKLREEAQRELDALKERFRRYAPQRSDEELDIAVLLSEEGTAIRLRAETPSEVDLQKYLSAWLGDISAHELFLRWEIERANRRLRDPEAEPAFEGFLEQWREVRRIFFVPSYARILTLLSPIYDAELDRVGYWRVVLPRPAWVRLRIQATPRSPEWYHVPLDLVPDVPFGLWLLDRLSAEEPELLGYLREGRYRIIDENYELLGKPRRQNPEQAFRAARLSVVLEPAAGRATRLLISADLGIDPGKTVPRLERLEFEVDGDANLHRLTRDVRLPRTAAALAANRGGR